MLVVAEAGQKRSTFSFLHSYSSSSSSSFEGGGGEPRIYTMSVVAKRFALLLCAEDSDYVKNNYGGYFGVFLSMLSTSGEVWDLYRVFSGQFPRDHDISLYDGFVITGSCNDAHGDDIWICNLLVFLKKLHSLKKKILGICFGHQILCRALGGKTGRAKKGWDIGLRTVQLSTSSDFLSSLRIKTPLHLSIIECHRDEVCDLPPGAEVLGWSNQTRIEMFRYEGHIMGIQGHPEYSFDILSNIVDRLTKHNFIKEKYGKDLCVELRGQPDIDPWRKLCISFLKGVL